MDILRRILIYFEFKKCANFLSKIAIKLSLWIIFLSSIKYSLFPQETIFYYFNLLKLLDNIFCTKNGQIEKGFDFKSLLRIVSGLIHKISTGAVEKQTDKFLSLLLISNAGARRG